MAGELYEASAGAYTVRLTPPTPGGDFFTITVNGDRFLSVRTEAEALARAHLLALALNPDADVQRSVSVYELELNRRRYLALRRSLVAAIGAEALGSEEPDDAQLVEAAKALADSPIVQPRRRAVRGHR